MNAVERFGCLAALADLHLTVLLPARGFIGQAVEAALAVERAAAVARALAPPPPPWTHRYAWRSGPLGPNPVREQLHGRRCRIVRQGGRMGTVVLLVEGFGLVATSRRALRRL